MAQYSGFDQTAKQLITAVDDAAAEAQQDTDNNHCLLYRFYTDIHTVNSKAYQAKIPAGRRPSQDELIQRAALHMFAGQTENSYFISFFDDIEVFLRAVLLGGAEVSWVVRSIITGAKPELYGKKDFEQIAQPPAKFIGIFKVLRTNVISWNDPGLDAAVAQLKKTNPAKYMDLKSNYKAEHEVVAYYPEALEAPVKQVNNPYYEVYKQKVPEAQRAKLT